MIHSKNLNERELFGRDPDPMTPVERFIVALCAMAASAIIGGLVWLCLVLIRG